jgi:hypothetical protein
MKSLKQKLYGLIFIVMIIFSYASSTFRKVRSHRRRFGQDEVIGFFHGLIVELTNIFYYENLNVCVLQALISHGQEIYIDNIRKVYERIQEQRIQKVNVKGMNSYFKDTYRYKSIEKNPRYYLNQLTNYLDSSAKEFYSNIQDFIDNNPSLKNMIENASETFKLAKKIFDSHYFTIPLDIIGCIVFAYPGEENSESNDKIKYFLKILSWGFEKISYLIVIAIKIPEVFKEINNLYNNFNNNALNTYQKYVLLGRIIGSIVRVIVSLNGLGFIKKLK